MTGRAAVELLGVKRKTLYAYASRGLVRSEPMADDASAACLAMSNRGSAMAEMIPIIPQTRRSSMSVKPACL